MAPGMAPAGPGAAQLVESKAIGSVVAQALELIPDCAKLTDHG